MNAIRTATINIDTIVPDSYQWVNADIQLLELDENKAIKSISNRSQQLHRRIDEVATEIISVYDPVTRVTSNISVAGIGTAITQIMIKWMLEDNPNSYFDPETGRVILDGTS